MNDELQPQQGLEGNASGLAVERSSLFRPAEPVEGDHPFDVPLSEALRKIRPELAHRAWRKGLSEHDAQDAASEAITKVLSAVKNGSRPRMLRTYAHRALRSVLADHYGNHYNGNGQVRIAVGDVPDSADDHPTLDLLPDDSPWHEFLDRHLSPRRQKAFLLREIKGMGYDQIAAEMGIKPSTVRVHVFHARACLAIFKGQRPDKNLLP